MANLFRPEAVSHATRRLPGSVILATSVPASILIGCLVVVILSLIAFFSTATYARKEKVGGWLTPQAGLIRLTARQGGIVENVQAMEGQSVAAGQTLVSMQISTALGNEDSYVALSRSIRTQGKAADAQNQARISALDAEHVQLLARRDALKRERLQVRHRLNLQAERVKLAQVEVERAETIAAKGFLPRRDLDARRSAEMALEQDFADLSTQALSYDRQIGEVTARLLAIPIDKAAARAGASSTRAGLDQQATQTEAQSNYGVVSTLAGEVVALPVRPGQSIAPGVTVAVLTPANSPLEAELYVPSRAAGFIRQGQEVRLMYQAYPHQKFGTGQGVVASVSRTVLAPSEVAIPGLQVQEPVFRVRVKLSRDTITAYGQDLRLQPGMLLSADVIIDRRTLFEWLLDPLYAVGRR